jgi:hypothetical protein
MVGDSSNSAKKVRGDYPSDASTLTDDSSGFDSRGAVRGSAETI